MYVYDAVHDYTLVGTESAETGEVVRLCDKDNDNSVSICYIRNNCKIICICRLACSLHKLTNLGIGNLLCVCVCVCVTVLLERVC